MARGRGKCCPSMAERKQNNGAALFACPAADRPLQPARPGARRAGSMSDTGAPVCQLEQTPTTRPAHQPEPTDRANNGRAQISHVIRLPWPARARKRSLVATEPFKWSVKSGSAPVSGQSLQRHQRAHGAALFSALLLSVELDQILASCCSLVPF